MPGTFEAPRSSRRQPSTDGPAPAPFQAEQDVAPAPAPSGGGNGLIRSGWSAGQQEMDKSATYAQAFKPDANFQIIRFLEDAPYANYRRHWIERMTSEGVKKRPYTCLESTGNKCPLCDIGDKPQAVSSFNVALIGDDGVPMLKSWDVGSRVFGTLKAFSNDPMVGALSKGYWAVSKTGKGGNTQYNVLPKTEADLRNQGFVIPTEEAVARIGVYDPSIITIPSYNDLSEVAQEIQDY